MGVQPYQLSPSLPESSKPLTDRLYRDLEAAPVSPVRIRHLLQELLASDTLASMTEEDRLPTELFFRVLGDLIRQGWSFELSGGGLAARPPAVANGRPEDQAEVKRRLQTSLIKARNEQFHDPGVRRFLRMMERPRWYRGRQTSVSDLFLSGETLAADLRRRLESPPSVRDDLLRRAIRPYLQMATEDRDEWTGLRLNHIWRYTRYSWSLPYSGQPGRQVAYLVRDAARDHHPIIGIGALGNSVAQITCRDDSVGWTLDAFKLAVVEIGILKRRIEELGAKLESELTTQEAGHVQRQLSRARRDLCSNQSRLSARFHAMEAEISRALEEVYSEDLVSADEIANPSAEVLERLAANAEEIAALNTLEGERKLDIDEDVFSPKYTKKRAVEVYQLLRTRLVFRQTAASANGDTARQIDLLMESKEGQQAIGTSLRSIKKRHMGSSMMDITTCGAVAPYNELLGGKLVSLLMGSPQVISDYRYRYQNSPSEIASRMKGEQIVRPPTLVLLGTTSLYHVGSSQYNRVSAPVDRGKLEYSFVGKTRGFGSVHLSKTTYRAVQELLRKHPELEAQSSAFAAGVNYKLRSISSALQYIGLGRLQQHETPRLVYMVPLATNWQDYLLGLATEPEYLFNNLDTPEEGTTALATYWRERWFLPRVRSAEVLDRMARQKSPIRVTTLMQNGGSSSEDAGALSREDIPAPGNTGNASMTIPTALTWQTLSELKDQRASFAERLTEEELRALHVSTKLDQSLVDLVSSGRRLYLTGNPGDGKTHIIQRYRAELEDANAYLHLDASADDEGALLDGLNCAAREDRPAVIAINEGPLRKLLRRLPSPDRDQLEVQLDQPFIYNGGGNESDHRAVVVNLGARQVLSPTILGSALDLVLGRVDFTGAPASIIHNQSLLSRPRVRERLQVLLSYVARSGAHVTMHELFGFLSWIITGGVSRSDMVAPPYYELIFAPESPLSRWLRDLDPASIPHPLLDMALWDGKYEGIEWIETPVSKAPVDHEDLQGAMRAFDALKRRYYFEAREGDGLLSMLPEDQRTFHTLLLESQSARETATVRLIDALSHFYGDVSTGAQDNQIRIWTSLRYEVIGPATAFISSQVVPPERVHVAVPRVRPVVANLLEYEPTHLRLIVDPPGEGNKPITLDIDFELWIALMRLQRGMPQRYHDPVIGRRLHEFMSRLAAAYQAPAAGYVELYVRDVELERTYHARVSLETRKYLWE